MRLLWIQFVFLLASSWFASANRREEMEFERRQDSVLARRSGKDLPLSHLRKRGSRTWKDELEEREEVNSEVDGEAVRQILEKEERDDKIMAESGLEHIAKLTSREQQVDAVEQPDEEVMEEEKEEDDEEDKEEKKRDAPQKIMIGYYLHPTIYYQTQVECLQICYNMGINCTLYV